MDRNEPFPLNMTQKFAIRVYLGKIKKQYRLTHFTILHKRGILKENGIPTLLGNMLLRKHNGGEDYAQRPVPKRKRATKKRRKNR